MRRPLAVFGLLFLFCLLLFSGLGLPASFALGAGLGLAAAVSVMVLRRIGRGRGLPGGRAGRLLPGASIVASPLAYLPLLLASAAFALLWRGGYTVLVAQPVRALADTEADVVVRVLEVAPAGYGEGLVHADVQVLLLDETPPEPSLRVRLNAIPETQPGELLQLRVRFSAFAGPAAGARNAARGQYVAASVVTQPVSLGMRHSALTWLRGLQYAAGDNIRGRLPHRLSSVLAAMAVGDRRTLSPGASDAFRAAGLSHLLVVSGLHLALLCGVLYSGSRRIFPRRAAAVLGMVFTLFFMVFTGLKPSILRSGTLYLVMLLGVLAERKADSFTSMGAAALAICIQNPFAAADVGLLLSFAATGGVLLGDILAASMKKNWDARPAAGLLRRGMRRFAQAALLTLCATAAILPVLAWAGLPLSVFTLPANLVAVPMMTPILLGGALAALPAGVPVLAQLARLGALVAGGLLVLLERITGWIAAIPWATVALTGGFALVATLLVYGFAFVGWRLRRPLAGILGSLLLLVPAFALHLALDKGTVRVAVVGGTVPSLVVLEERQAIVLYRGQSDLRGVERVLKEAGAKACVLWVDLRKEPSTTSYPEGFAPLRLLRPGKDFFLAEVARPLPSVSLYLRRQAGGTLACLDIGGYRVAITSSGEIDMRPYGPVDMLVATDAQVEGSYGVLLCNGAVPPWARPQSRLLQAEGNAWLHVRPGGGIKYREVWDGIGLG